MNYQKTACYNNKIKTALLLCFFLFNFWKALPAQRLQIDKDLLDFGRVTQGAAAEFTLTITNTSDEVLNAGFRPSCECISVIPESAAVGPRQKAVVRVVVNTKDYLDDFQGSVYVQSNDAENPYFQLVVKGIITGAAVSQRKPLPLNKSNVPDPGQTIQIHATIFASASCKYCLAIKRSLIPVLEKKHNVRLMVDALNLDLPHNYELLAAIEESRKIKSDRVPVVFIGSDVLSGKIEINNELDRLVNKYKLLGGAEKIELPALKNRSAGKMAVEKLRLAPLVAAGFIDSINPCAFATLIFFISYLSLVLKKKRLEIAVAGFVFIFGVFITYFLIGLGFFGALRTLNGFTMVSKIVYAATGLFALVLGLRHAYEAVLIRKTGDIENSIKLKLPEIIRGRLYGVIKKFSSFRYLVPVAFVLASVVTLLELFCTGQVYLPAIMYLISLRQYSSTAAAYLALYCVLFVLPLLIVFSLYYFGMTTEKLKRFFKNNIVTGKIITALFFLSLAAAMFIQL